MTDLDRASRLLIENHLSCVLCKGETVYQSRKRGVAPLVELIVGKTDLEGFSAADRVIGKAAALLLVLAGISEVYAPVTSESAVEVLKSHGVKFLYDECVPFIVNRAGDGQCPMEQAVRDTDNPQTALAAVTETMRRLSEKSERPAQPENGADGGK